MPRVPTEEIVLERISNTGRDLDEATMVAARAFHHHPFFVFLDPAASPGLAP